MILNLVCTTLYLFTLTAAGNMDEMDQKQVKEMIFKQLRMNVATKQVKRSLALSNKVLKFNSQIQNIHDSALLRLNCKVAELQYGFDQVSKFYRRKRVQVQDLDSKLGEYQQRVQELEQKINDLNRNAVCRKDVCWEMECEQIPHLEEISQVVQKFISNTDWNILSRGLATILDHSSVVYMQLQEAGSLNNVGYYGFIELATLLLCAGLPVDTSDINKDTMLLGAAKGEELQLAKLLMDHGASVDVRDSIDRTPLMSAAFQGNIRVVKWLVQFGADTALKDSSGKSALDIALKRNMNAVSDYLKNLPH